MRRALIIGYGGSGTKTVPTTAETTAVLLRLIFLWDFAIAQGISPERQNTYVQGIRRAELTLKRTVVDDAAIREVAQHLAQDASV